MITLHKKLASRSMAHMLTLQTDHMISLINELGPSRVEDKNGNVTQAHTEYPA